MKYKTVGLDPKLPTQAVVVVIAFVLSHFGVNLTVEVSLALATIIGFVAGFFAPAPKTTLAPKKNGEAGFYDPIYILVLLIVVVVLVYVIKQLL